MSYIDTVLPIVKEIRNIVLPGYGLANIIDEKSANPADVVTNFDIKVEEFLKDKLSKAFPEIGFVGEEHGGDRNAERFWIVDPIDGTGYYIRGLPFCTTMFALIEHGIVTFSVIYDFVADNIYWAEKGKGAYMNDTKIHVSDRDFKHAYLSWATKNIKENLNKFMKIDEVGSVRFRAGGWEFAMIASGKLDGRATFNPPGKDYDFAPGSLLVSEAGGIVTNIGSSDYDYRNVDFIAGNPKVHKELENIFKNYKKP
jgi:myo-inositol-1(or 4)-monophosphatase